MTASIHLIGRIIAVALVAATLSACDNDKSSNSSADTTDTGTESATTSREDASTQPAPTAPKANDVADDSEAEPQQSEENTSEELAGSEETVQEQPPVTEEPAQEEPVQTEEEPFEPFTISFSWDVPTTRTNGEPLPISEIGGYEIIYMNMDGSYQGKVDVAGGEITTADLEIVTPGVYMFAIRSYDSNAVYSEMSDPISATL